jgi:phage terminase large subunit
VVQFVHQEIRVLDYIEGQGQVLGYYTQELHHRGYDKVLCTLPHDGTNTNAITGLKYADHLRDTGFSVNVVPKSSHAADAFGLMAIKYEEPGRMANFRRKLEYPPLGIV